MILFTCSKLSTVTSPAPSGEAYFLPCQQQVLVHVRAQEACVAVAFHQFIDVVLKKEKKKDLDQHIYLSLSIYSELLLADLCVLIAVPPRVPQVLTCTLVAVGVQIDGAGCSLSQELHPDVLHSLCHILLGHSLQVLDRQPETATPRREHMSKNNNQYTFIHPSVCLKWKHA